MRQSESVRRPLAMGLLTIAALVGGIGLWSATTPIAGAVVASGKVVVDGNRRSVQHPDGGVVETVMVAEGERVEAGSVLLRFDGRLLRSERAVVAGQIAEIEARRARLLAERDGASTVALPQTLEGAARELAEGQVRLFHARAIALERQVQQLAERISQTEAEIAGTEARAAALRAERALVAEEVNGLESLLDRGLTQRTRVTVLRRDIARIDGDLGELSARTARLRAEIAETRLAILALESDRREAAIAELRNLAVTEAELRERAIGLDGTLARLDVRAPVAGTVLGLRVSAPGAVVRPAEVMLDLVPRAHPLVIEVPIDGADIDTIHTGQPARLRLSAFDRRTTPDIAARVLRVSPDIFVDEATGASYYKAALQPDLEALRELDGITLVPGMPVDAFLLTGERTAFEYLLGPFGDYFARAFREE